MTTILVTLLVVNLRGLLNGFEDRWPKIVGRRIPTVHRTGVRFAIEARKREYNTPNTGCIS